MMINMLTAWTFTLQEPEELTHAVLTILSLDSDKPISKSLLGTNYDSLILGFAGI